MEKREAKAHNLPPHSGSAQQRRVVRQAYTGKRAERKVTGITARQQRRRRIQSIFPAEFGTRRGERKYLGVLNRITSLLYIPGKPLARICVAITQKHPGRVERRWLERYFTAQDKEA